MAAIESYLGEPLEVAAAAREDRRGGLFAAVHRGVGEVYRSASDPGICRASGYRFLIDTMYGAGKGYIAGIFSRAGIPFVEIRSEINPAFPGINPEPILPHIAATQKAVVAEQCDAGLITDGDADRIGAVDEHGNVVDAHKIYAVLLEWLLKRKGWPGDVTRAFNTTKMLDRIAAKYGRKLHEHGIGFKYVCDLMLEQEILIGGEESGGIGISRHLPERDGLLNSLLLANVMADERKTLGELVAALQEEYGEHQYGRMDMHITEELKQSAIRARESRAERACRVEGAARGDAGRDQVLSREPGVRREAQCCGDLAAAARQRNGAAAAGVLRELRYRQRGSVLAAAQAFVLRGDET